MTSVCDLLAQLVPADTTGEFTPPDVVPPTDVDAIRASLARSPAAAPVPATPLSGAQMGASTTPAATSFATQDPIYLLPAQAQAQSQSLVAQQSQSVLGIFLKRVFSIFNLTPTGA